MKQFIAVLAVAIFVACVMEVLSDSTQPSPAIETKRVAQYNPERSAVQAPVESWSKTEIANPSKPHDPRSIIAIFNDNEVMGEAKFSGPNVIEGLVAGIETGFVSGAYVEIGDGYGSTVNCVVKETDKNSLLYLHKGQKVVLQGYDAKQHVGTIFFHDCTLL